MMAITATLALFSMAGIAGFPFIPNRKKIRNNLCKLFDLSFKLLRANRINQNAGDVLQMARIRIRHGENEVEIESKDFYIDNQTAGDIISSLSAHVKEGSTDPALYYDQAVPNSSVLGMFEEAEVPEPEFARPSFLDKRQIREKVRTLVDDEFFDEPRTVSEVVSQLHEYGWTAVPLDVSKVLTDMAFTNDLRKDLRDRRSYYSAAKVIELN